MNPIPSLSLDEGFYSNITRWDRLVDLSSDGRSSAAEGWTPAGGAGTGRRGAAGSFEAPNRQLPDRSDIVQIRDRKLKVDLGVTLQGRSLRVRIEGRNATSSYFRRISSSAGAQASLYLQ